MAGIQPMSKVTRAVVITAVVISIIFAAGTIILYAQNEAARRHQGAQTALGNCQQIEIVKDQIRDTVRSSLRRLPEIRYYKRHPDELAQALQETRGSINRFRQRDCYALPVVKAAGITRPKS